MTTQEQPFDYTLYERIYDATRDAAEKVSGMATVAVVVALNNEVTVDLFGDYDTGSANLAAATYYAETCRRLDGARTFIIGADILD